MERPPATRWTGSAFNDFLYAQVGTETNGMNLTLLSAFARRNVDPWTQAADLCSLSGEAAMQQLTAMLPLLPGACTPVERTALAARLMTLLPRSVGLDPPGRVPAVARFKPSSALLIFVGFALLLLSQWIMLDRTVPDAAAAPTSLDGAPVVKPPVSPPAAVTTLDSPSTAVK